MPTTIDPTVTLDLKYVINGTKHTIDLTTLFNVNETTTSRCYDPEYYLLNGPTNKDKVITVPNVALNFTTRLMTIDPLTDGIFEFWL